MAHRVFIDSAFREWSVWDTNPNSFLEYAARPGLLVAEAMRSGWLTFQSSGPDAEKRRVAPIPDRWDELSLDELELLCRRATLVRAAR